MYKDNREFIEIEQKIEIDAKIKSDVLPFKNQDPFKDEFAPSEKVSTNNNKVTAFLNSQLDYKLLNQQKKHNSIEVYSPGEKKNTQKAKRDPKVRKSKKQTTTAATTETGTQ